MIDLLLAKLEATNKKIDPRKAVLFFEEEEKKSVVKKEEPKEKKFFIPGENFSTIRLYPTYRYIPGIKNKEEYDNYLSYQQKLVEEEEENRRREEEYIEDLQRERNSTRDKKYY